MISKADYLETEMQKQVAASVTASTRSKARRHLETAIQFAAQLHSLEVERTYIRS